MNKKLMAVAVAGALAAPSAAVMAQTSSVQIGGFIQILYFQHKPENSAGVPAGQSSDVMRDSESNVYIRGEEKLGGGLSVWFQCESSMGGIVVGGASTGFCTRNSGIGFKGSWGNAFVGYWDTPQKTTASLARGWWGAYNALNGGHGPVLYNGGPGGPSGANGLVAANQPWGFFRRHSNTVNYHSPAWNGFSFQAAFSSSNEQSGLAEGNPLSPRLWSMNGTYRSGPLTVGAAYERHDDFNPGLIAAPGTVGSLYQGGNDTQWNIMAGYTFGAFSIRGIYVDTEYEVTTTTNADTDGWALFADWNIQGPHTLRMQYYNLDDISGNSTVAVGNYSPAIVGGVARTATGAKGLGLAYSYAMSKRTELSFVYNKLDNDTNAAFGLGITGASAGRNQKAIGGQIRHRF